MIANCGQLGLDYERVSLGEYAEALEAHNMASEEGDKSKPDLERLKRFKAARAH